VQRILRGSAATLRSSKLNSEGEAVAPSGAVTVEVTRWDGSVVIAAGTATGVDGADRTIALTPTQTAQLDRLTATWTDAGDNSSWTTTAEIVGGFYFSIAEARASDKTLEDATKYPDADILATRAEVEEEFEEICGRAFVPRFGTFIGTGGAQVLPDPHLRKLRSVTVDGTAYTAAEVEGVRTDEAGIIATTARRGARVVVSYEHGLDSPPADLKRAALTRLRSRLNMSKSAVPDRATSFSTETGTFRLSMPRADRTGIPDVDAVLDRYALRTPTVA
jgi:hypothetical protein